MVKIIYWSLLTKTVGFLTSAPKQCVNFGAGVICGVAQAVGVEIFTKDTVNEALGLKTAADTCGGELPIKLTAEHDQVSEIMTEGGKAAISKAQAVMKSTGVDEKCIAIFGLVCSKAEQFGAIDIIKNACANL